MATTVTKDEAMELLMAYRRWLIERGREIATEMCLRSGTVTSRDVRAAMNEEVAEAQASSGKSIKEHWLGAVFNTPAFEWTGEYRHPGGGGYLPGTHEGQRVKVWRLRREPA